MNSHSQSTSFEDTLSQRGFFEIAFQKSVMSRAAKIAAVVGVILGILNHGDRVVTGHFDLVMMLKIFLTFLVPYCVSTYTSVLAVRERRKSTRPQQTR